MRNIKRAAGLCGIGVLAATSLLACRDDEHGAKGRGPGSLRSHPGPAFPGAGLSGAGAALSAGSVTISCNQHGPFPGGTQGPAPGATATQECYYDAAHPHDPAATMEWIVESAPAGELVHVRLTFNPWFVDNTYGANAIGWDDEPMPGAGANTMPKPKPRKGGHTFKDLVGSDHAEFTLRDADGATVLKFKADYLSESRSAPSGYQSLGVDGGEGKMLVGDANDVVAVSTSLDRNLNVCGLGDFTVDSPSTDTDYSPSAEAPNWDFRVVYDVWVRQSAFARAGFGKASVEFVHASPSKADGNTIEVEPRPCPPTWQPYCPNPEGCGDRECGGLDVTCGPGNYGDAGVSDAGGSRPVW